MVKYLNAEFYKAFQRKYLYIFVGVCLALVAFLLFLIRVESRSMVNDVITMRVNMGDLVGIVVQGLGTGLYLLMIAADIVFSEQYKYNTLKNEVSFGLPRLRIYFGKLLASFFVAAVLCLVLLGGYLALSGLLFPLGAEIGESLRMLALCLLMALPLWIGGLSLFHMLQFFLKGSTAASIVYIMVLGVGSGFLDMMGLFLPTMKPVADLVRTISLNTPFNLMVRQGPESAMGYAWLLGMSYLVISSLVGVIGFKKKEIN